VPILYPPLLITSCPTTQVAQLVGYLSEHVAYHHGEQSLMMTIINLAQDYVGSNNLNLLLPNGQFEMCNQGSKDHASACYIVTGSWDKASLYTLWTGVSSGTGLFHDVVVASAVIVDMCFRICVLWTSSDGQRGWNAVELVVSASYFMA
jgi:hypothetical protein